MPYMTAYEAEQEVSTWNIKYIQLQPALITSQSLWEDYTARTKNSEYAATICEMSVSAAAEALTGSTAFSAINWVTDKIAETLKDAVVDTAIEKAVDRIAGAHMTKYEQSDKSYELSADKKLATKLVSGFLTVIVAAAGGALTAVTAGSAGAVAAIAIIVWIGDKQEAARLKRWKEIVNSSMIKYGDIRDKKERSLNTIYRNRLERNVMLNAYHDFQDEGKIQIWNWTYKNQAVISNFQLRNLKKLQKRMMDVDEALGKELWIIDLLEITKTYRDACVYLWDHGANTAGSDMFDNKLMQGFMKSQIEGHASDAMTLKVDSTLAAMREQAIADYHNAKKVADEKVTARSPYGSVTGTAGAGQRR